MDRKILRFFLTLTICGIFLLNIVINYKCEIEFIFFLTVLLSVVQARNFPTANDVWTPSYYTKFSGIRDENDDLALKVEIIRKFIENGKLSRQANFENYADQLFTKLINSEIENVKITPEEFSKSIENFQFDTSNDDEDDDEDENMKIRNLIQPTRESRQQPADTGNQRRPPKYQLNGKCGK